MVALTVQRAIVRALLLAATIGTQQSAAQLNDPLVPPPPEVYEREKIIKDPNSLRDGGPGNFRAAAAGGTVLSRTGWTATTDSAQSGQGGGAALDGNTGSFWHSEYSPTLSPLPHTITIDMKQNYNVVGLAYLPRQDGNGNGHIGRHQIFVSQDGSNFGQPVAFGTWLDDASRKVSPFEPQVARFVRLVALSEAGDSGPWTSAAEIEIYGVPSFTPTPNGVGKWGPTIDFPIVPVAAAVEQDSGNVVVWSAQFADNFAGGSGRTETAVYSPSARTVTQRLVSNTGHDMFCPGISRDVNGRLVVTGGNNAPKTSIYNPVGDVWSNGADMRLARGYQSSTTCSDGRIFTIGGSWSGGEGNKNGEIYDPVANTWTLLPSCPVAPMLTADTQGVYRSDNHAWLFGWKNGAVFQAGPSRAMNWYGTTGSGSRTGVGNRLADGDSMCGNAVMYDAVAGKILTVGGSPNYQNSAGTTAAHIITINNPGSTPSVVKVGSMAVARMFANGVVLPDGTTFVVGGQRVGRPFSDEEAHYVPELFNPATNGFTNLARNTVPRTYHSVSVLLMDGTVFVGGGGLCGSCSTNHFDAQIFTPQYLLTSTGAPATRPAINSLSATSFAVGATITINTNTAITRVALIRFGSNTHSVDTDQRRIPLTPTSVGTNSYTVRLPTDAGVALPGSYMLFVLNSAGVPSVARAIQIRPS